MVAAPRKAARRVVGKGCLARDLLRSRDAEATGGGRRTPVWLFDLDNTLHDASHAAFGPTNRAMTDYIVEHLGLPEHEASALRQHYWNHYGATLLGLVRHHGIKAAHFLEQTHRLPGLEAHLRTSAHDRAALRRLPGRKVVLTNAPRAYALRVMGALGLAPLFDEVLSVEDMAMFGHARPKPDTRMFRHIAARMKVPLHRCVLVEDTLMHQRAARAVGMRCVWMQRYVRRMPHGPEVGARLRRKPVYVYARINSIRALCALTLHV